jgi:hypothetical protein
MLNDILLERIVSVFDGSDYHQLTIPAGRERLHSETAVVFNILKRARLSSSELGTEEKTRRGSSELLVAHDGPPPPTSHILLGQWQEGDVALFFGLAVTGNCGGCTELTNDTKTSFRTSRTLSLALKNGHDYWPRGARH